ncbi:putative cytochrome P450 [Tricladium varicosporioides]|nr:putative cytochrome P450 [Hymenoscyphus varicosporioides]
MLITRVALLSCLLAAVGWAVYSSYCLVRNYLVARKLGIPIRIIPISHENLLWMIVDRKIFIPLFSRVPFGSGSFTRYNWRGWEFRDKGRSHQEMGDTFVLVTPGRNFVYIRNAQTMADIFQRRLDFPRPLELYELTNIFGENISTVDGAQWQRHRKILASCFTEKNNEMVWAETLHQARNMLQYWISRLSVGSTADDARTLSLNVLSCAGFGKPYPFHGADSLPQETSIMNYQVALQTILDHGILLMVLGTRLLSFPFLPLKLKKLSHATNVFKQYMTEIYETEKFSFRKQKPARFNIVTSLIRASETAGCSGGLTESEIYGNIFVFNFAGHDTTSHTLTFAIFLLATEPSIQDWITEEIHHVFGNRAIEKWNFNEDFTKLNRSLAVMHETLRLYPPVSIAKYTGQGEQVFHAGGRDIMIPPNTLVIPSHVALHTDPRYWGKDSLYWDPGRWITKESDSIVNESIYQPEKCSFIPWSGGARICPGKMFSQVEFVATMAVLFQYCRVEPVPRKGETTPQARIRVRTQIEEDTGQVLLLQMLHPERAPLIWKRRSPERK